VVALVSAVFGADAAPGWRNGKGRAGRKSAARTPRSYSTATAFLYLYAAWQLGDRLDNIRKHQFFDYLSEGSGREQDAKPALSRRDA
jgi:hypothetical protein